MWRIILFLLLFTSSVSLRSQVVLILTAPPYPNPEIMEWENGNGDPFNLTVINNTSVPIDVKIGGSITLNGQIVASIDLNKTPIKTLNPGTTSFTNHDLIPAEAIIFSNINTNQLYLSGKLPAGVYTYCVELTHPLSSNNSVIARSCTSFSISENQLPILQTPLNGEIFPENLANSKVFTWTPLIPTVSLPQTLKYRFLLCEVMTGQTPVQAIQANIPLIDEELDGSILTYPWPVTLTPDTGTFVWTIQSIDPNNLNSQNEPTTYGNASQNGYSFPHIFTIGDTSKTNNNNLLDELTGDTLYAGLNGEFKILLDSNVTSVSGNSNDPGTKFSGTGKVYIQMFRAWFDVSFTDIKIDQNMKLEDGLVYVPKYNTAPVYPTAWINQATNLNWSHNTIDAIDNFLNNANNLLTLDLNTLGDSIPIWQSNNNSNVALRVPQGINGADFGSVNNINLAFTDIVFTPNQSEISAVMSMGVPASWEVLNGTNALGFKAKDFLFHPNDFEFSKGRLELVDDLRINLDGNKYAVIFQKPEQGDTTGRMGTFYEWDKQGDSSMFSVDLDVEFSRELMFPANDPNGSSKVFASFNGSSKNWNDFLFNGNLPLAEIASTNGLKIEAQNMVVDFSEIRNGSNISFPSLYNGETSNLFKGFYLQQASLHLPDEIKTHASGGIVISLQEVIIDKTGFTFDLEANNIYSYPNVDMADLVASLDTIRLSMVQNTVSQGMLSGKVTLPVSEAKPSNALEYRGLFSNGGAFSDTNQSYFNFNISPVNNIEAELWKADLIISNTSQMSIDIGVGQDKGRYGFDLSIDGEISISADLGPVKDVRLGGILFQGLGISHYELTPATGSGTNGGIWAGKQQGFNFNSGAWAFASPQKKLSGFNFSIQNININSKASQQGESYRGELMFTGVINLTDNIGGGVGMGLTFAIKEDGQVNSTSNPTISSPKSNLNGFTVGSGTNGSNFIGRGFGGIGGTRNGTGGTRNSTEGTRSGTGGGSNGGTMGGNPSRGGLSNYDFDITHPQDLVHIAKILTPNPPSSVIDCYQGEFISARLDSIFVNVSTPAVDINGHVKLRQDHPTFGNGFKGKVSANFKAIGVQIDAEAEFGRTTYQSLVQDTSYRYWRVEGGAGWPSPGIPMGPIPLSFRGAGLGAYYNMVTSLPGQNQADSNQAAVANALLQTPGDNINSLTSGLNFVPKEGGWGFMGKIRCATSDGKAFNFDMGLRAQFIGSSLQQIVLRGDFWAGATIPNRNKAWLNGYATMGYEPPSRHFYLNSAVNFNKAPIQGFVPFDIDIDGVGPSDPSGSQLEWYVRMGTPQNPATVNVNLSNADNSNTGNGDGGNNSTANDNLTAAEVASVASVSFYLMTGNNIPQVTGFSQDFINDYNTAVGNLNPNSSTTNQNVNNMEGVDQPQAMTQLQSLAGPSSSDMSQAATGSGFILGIGLKMGKPNRQFKNVFGDKVKFWYRFGAGAEISAGFFDNYICSGQEGGIEGWRANGGMGFWATAGTGLQIKPFNVLWKQYCQNYCNITLFDLGIGAWIYGEFPNPTFAAAGLDGKVKILNLLKVKFNANFKFGEKCNPGSNPNNLSEIDAGFFDSFNWSPSWSYDRRSDNDRPDIMNFAMDSKVVDETYWWRDANGNGQSIVVRAVPSVVSFNWNNGSGAKRRTGAGGNAWAYVANSNLLLNTCEHKGKFYRWGWHYKNRWNNNHSCHANRTQNPETGLEIKKNKGQKLYLAMKFKLYKRSLNSNVWTPLTFDGQTVEHTYNTTFWNLNANAETDTQFSNDINE